VNEDQLARLIRAAWDEQPPNDLDWIVAEARRRERAAGVKHQLRRRSGRRSSLPIGISVFLLPRALRGRYAAEWAAELEWLEREKQSRHLRGYLFSLLISAAILRATSWTWLMAEGWLAPVAWVLSVVLLSAGATIGLLGSDSRPAGLVLGLLAGLLMHWAERWRRRSVHCDEPPQELDREESS
jgi:hypothetical protein